MATAASAQAEAARTEEVTEAVEEAAAGVERRVDAAIESVHSHLHYTKEEMDEWRREAREEAQSTRQHLAGEMASLRERMETFFSLSTPAQPSAQQTVIAEAGSTVVAPVTEADATPTAAPSNSSEKSGDPIDPAETEPVKREVRIEHRRKIL